MNGKCTHHEAIDVRIDHCESSIEQIRKMFWAIIFGLFLGLVGIYGNLYTSLNGNGAQAHEYTVSDDGRS